MALSARTKRIVALALADSGAGAELCAAIDESDGTASAVVTPVAVTFTSGGTPSDYTTPTGATTVAVSGTPTVQELLAYCNELRGNITELVAVLVAHGLVT